jgi:hypothetical protein
MTRTQCTCTRCGSPEVTIDLTAPTAQWLCDACLQERNKGWRANAVRVEYTQQQAEPAVEQNDLTGDNGEGWHPW